MKTAHLGMFSAEDYWRDPDLARLPRLPDPAADRIVAAMDELLFPLCEPGDALLTRYAMDDALADYLERVGFRFERNRTSLEDGGAAPGASIFALASVAAAGALRGLLRGVRRVAPYAVLADTAAFCEGCGLDYDGPPIDTVRKVNSKIYSHQVAVELGLKDYGCVVDSAAATLDQGRRMLAQGGLLLKDPFGVSGKGNLLVTSEGMLQRIAAHLGTQERAGKRVSLLLEPFLDKKLDFSCQMRIDADGAVHHLSWQRMHNQQLAYRGSSRLDGEQAAYLERMSYAGQAQVVAERLYRDGYWGALCIDAMILRDGSVAPVVEINARQSMGLINHHLEQFFAGQPVYLGYLSLGRVGALDYAAFLGALERAALLFEPAAGRGIMPLTSNTLTINMNRPGAPESPGKGRFYFALVAAAEEREAWLERLRERCQAAGFLVYT